MGYWIGLRSAQSPASFLEVCGMSARAKIKYRLRLAVNALGSHLTRGRRLCALFFWLGLVTLYGCSVLYQKTLVAFRQSGEHIRTFPDQLWRELNCSDRELPFVQFESMEVLPEMIRPGTRANYRLVYAMCPVRPSEVIETRLLRKIIIKGEQVISNAQDSLELKPGRWVVDSFFTLPEESPLGTYELEIILEYDHAVYKMVRRFDVSSQYYLISQ
jgi:hypothetical protein